jgi:hypothetical protein
MAKNEIFVEERSGRYVALCGPTQEETGHRAHELRRNATIFGERVRDVSTGERDKWRVLHHPSR